MCSLRFLCQLGRGITALALHFPQLERESNFWRFDCYFPRAHPPSKDFLIRIRRLKSGLNHGTAVLLKRFLPRIVILKKSEVVSSSQEAHMLQVRHLLLHTCVNRRGRAPETQSESVYEQIRAKRCMKWASEGCFLNEVYNINLK